MSKGKDRVIRIYREFYEMLKDGSKTIEVRVNYHSMQNIQPGTILRFNDDPDCRFEVVDVRHYKTFKALLDTEDINRIDPTRDYNEQLRTLRRIFPPDKEKIGPVVYDLQRV